VLVRKEPNTTSYIADFSACEKGTSVLVRNEPNTTSYSTAFSACEKGKTLSVKLVKKQVSNHEPETSNLRARRNATCKT
jgi:hypothetical protein